jgi:hypothetical protein
MIVISARGLSLECFLNIMNLFRILRIVRTVLRTCINDRVDPTHMSTGPQIRSHQPLPIPSLSSQPQRHRVSRPLALCDLPARLFLASCSQRIPESPSPFDVNRFDAWTRAGQPSGLGMFQLACALACIILCTRCLGAYAAPAHQPTSLPQAPRQ